MRHANRPSGPGKPTTGRRDAAEEREELEEASEAPDASQGAVNVGGTDPTRGARTAERDAHTKSGGRSSGSDSGRRTGPQKT
jgi:hypothetical protein